MLQPFLKKNDKLAGILIIFVSLFVFIAITALASIKIDVNLSFDPHIFAGINAGLNATVAVLLIAGDQVPVTPLVEVVGKRGTAVFSQIGAIAVNVGTVGVLNVKTISSSTRLIPHVITHLYVPV